MHRKIMDLIEPTFSILMFHGFQWDRFKQVLNIPVETNLPNASLCQQPQASPELTPHKEMVRHDHRNEGGKSQAIQTSFIVWLCKNVST